MLPGKPPAGKALVESQASEDGGGELDLFRAIATRDGGYPFRHALHQVLHAPVQWIGLSLLPLLYHGVASWMVRGGWFARGDLFPTLFTPISQAVHAGMLVLVVGGALDAFGRTGPRGLFRTLARWAPRALVSGVAFWGLRSLLEASLGTLVAPLFGSLLGLLALLWIWLHVAFELACATPLHRVPGASLSRALGRLVAFPASLLRPSGRGRLLAAALPFSTYALLGLSAWGAMATMPFLPLWLVPPLATLSGFLGVTLASLNVCVLVLTWFHLDLAGRLERSEEHPHLGGDSPDQTPELPETSSTDPSASLPG